MNLKDLRLSKKMTQEELAEKLLVAVPTVRKWEQGKTIPSITDMYGIARVMNVEVAEVTSIYIFK